MANNQKVVEIKFGKWFWALISVAMFFTQWAVLYWFSGIVFTFTASVMILTTLFYKEKILEVRSKAQPIGASYIIDILIFASLAWQFLEKGYTVFAGAVFLTFIIGLTIRITKEV